MLQHLTIDIRLLYAKERKIFLSWDFSHKLNINKEMSNFMTFPYSLIDIWNSAKDEEGLE